MDLLVSIFLGYRNGVIAKRKGYNNIAWALYSIGAFLLLEIIGWSIMFAPHYNGSNKPEEFMQFMLESPIRAFTAFFCGIGGYLLIRYRLNKMPAKNIGE